MRNEEITWTRRTPTSEEIEQLAKMFETLARDLRGLQGNVVYIEAGFVSEIGTHDIMMERATVPVDQIIDRTNTLDVHIEVQHRR